MSTRAETARLRNAGRIPTETVAYLNSKKPDGGLTYPPDRWMRWLAEVVLLILLYDLLSDRPSSAAFTIVALIFAWMSWRSIYKFLQLAHRKYQERRASAS